MKKNAELARAYTEEYNPSYGTGLIPESIPMFNDIISFWRKSNTTKSNKLSINR